MHDDESSRSRRTPKGCRGGASGTSPGGLDDRRGTLGGLGTAASKKTYAEIEETFADWQRRQAEEAARLASLPPPDKWAQAMLGDDKTVSTSKSGNDNASLMSSKSQDNIDNNNNNNQQQQRGRLK